MVSDYLALARSRGDAGALASRTPGRFDADRAPVIVWNVCHHCNMSCPHCYIAAGGMPSRHDLSDEEALSIIDQLVDCGVKVLIFSGGEPLLREGVLDLIAYASGKGLSCHLSSNGTLIDDAMAARLKEAGIGYVGISIDGQPAFNDAWRGLENAFDLAVRGLTASRAAGMTTGLRITLTRRNRDDVWGLLELAESLGVGRFYVSHLLYAGRAHVLTQDDVTPAESRELLLELFEWADDHIDDDGNIRGPKIVTGGNDSDGVLLWSWIRDKHGAESATEIYRLLELRGGNSAGEGILNIDNRGRVHPDQFWTTATLAHLKKEPFRAALDHPLREQLRKRADLLNGRCGACRHKAVCRGSHRERAITVYEDMWGPDPSCVLTDDEVYAGVPRPEVEP